MTFCTRFRAHRGNIPRQGAYQGAGNRIGAIILMKESLAAARRMKGDDDPETMMGMSNLSAAYSDANNKAMALPLAEEALSTALGWMSHAPSKSHCSQKYL